MNKVIKNAQGVWVEAPMTGLDFVNPLVSPADTSGSLIKLAIGVLIGNLLSS